MAGVCGDGIVGGDRGLRRRQHRRAATAARLTAAVETGYECRVPGAPCVAASAATAWSIGGEACDDGNTTAGDGCSARLPGRAGRDLQTPGMPSKCTASSAATGEGRNEACDSATEQRDVPGRLQGPNGLFLGDGTRLLEDLRQGAEAAATARRRRRAPRAAATAPSRRARSATTATATGDGCDDEVQERGGLHLHAADAPRRRDLLDGRRQVPQLPVVYRDFKNESVSGGHPDFFYLGAPVDRRSDRHRQRQLADAFTKRYCVPNTSGPAKGGDATARTWDIAAGDAGRERQADLNAGTGGRPRPPASSSTGATTPTAATFRATREPARRGTNGLTYTTAPAATRCTARPAPVRHAQRRDQFGQWWTDSTFTGETRTRSSTLEMSRPRPAASTSSRARSNAVLRRLFPARSAGPVSRSEHSDAGGAGRDEDGAAPEAELLCNLLAVLVLERVVRRRRGLQGRPVPVPAQPDPPDTTANPDGMNARNVPAAGLVPRLLVHQRGALPVQVQRRVQPAVLRRRRPVHLHQRHPRCSTSAACTSACPAG